MAQIQFENGRTVDFEGNPTPEDIDFVAKQIGITPDTQSKEPGLLKSIAKDIIKPIARVGTNLVNAGQLALGKETTQPFSGDFLGEVKPVGMGGSFTEDIKDSLGVGLQIGSNLPVGSSAGLTYQGLKTAVQSKKLLPVLAKAAKPLFKEGALAGGAYGTGKALEEQQSLGGVVKSGVTGAVAGGVTTPVLGLGLPLVARGIKDIPKIRGALTNTPDKIIEQRAKELSKLDGAYASLRKASGYSKDGGSSNRLRVASTDVLVDSVDDSGTIRTKQQGGAIDQYKSQTIDGVENTVRENLVRLGEKVHLNEVERQLIKSVNQSNLDGSDLINALNNIEKEIAGYKLKADKDGFIQLFNVHDAKINTTKGINYLTPSDVKAYRKAIARGLKKTVEDNSSFNTEEVNAELGKYYEDIELLERLDGKKVKGGKLGKHFAKFSGNVAGGIVGHAMGGPLGSMAGTVIGGEVAEKIQGNALAKTFGNKLGNVAQKSKILQDASELGKSGRPLLTAPRSGQPKIQLESGRVINLPSKSQSTLDQESLSRLRAGRTIQDITSPIKNAAKNDIDQSKLSKARTITPQTITPPKLNKASEPTTLSTKKKTSQNDMSMTMPKVIPPKPVFNKGALSTVPKELESLATEARKYKSAEEFVDYFSKNTSEIPTTPEYRKFLQENDAFIKKENEIYAEMRSLREKYKGKTIKDVPSSDITKYDNLQKELTQTLSKKTLAKRPEGIIKTDIGDKALKEQLTDFYNKVVGKNGALDHSATPPLLRTPYK